MSQLSKKYSNLPPEHVWRYVLADAGRINEADCAKRTVLVIGSGLAGLATAYSLSCQGFRVILVYPSDFAFRGHSVAAQGGINGSSDTATDSDLVFANDILHGADYLSRSLWEVHRFAELSGKVIDELAHMGVKFTLRQDGTIDRRGFGGVKVKRTAYVGGETGKHVMRAFYQAVLAGSIEMRPYTYVLDPIVQNGTARGAVVLDKRTGEVEPILADAVVMATGGMGSAYFHSTNAADSSGGLQARLLEYGAILADPCMMQFHPTTIRSSAAKQPLASEASRNDARLWVPKHKRDRDKPPHLIPEEDRDYFMERQFVTGNLSSRDVTARAIMEQIEAGKGVGPGHNAVYMDMTQAADEDRERVERLYGSILETYQKFTGVDPYKHPMLITPSAHFSMGGIDVDHFLESRIRGWFVAGEANLSIHGANRLGANGILQMLIDGMFLINPGIQNYLARVGDRLVHDTDHAKDLANKWRKYLNRLKKKNGSESVLDLRRELGELMYKHAGIVRTTTGLLDGLKALDELEARLKNVSIGPNLEWNPILTDYLTLVGHVKLARFIILDALSRKESRGAHRYLDFPKRDDKNYLRTSLWRIKNGKPHLEKRPIDLPSDILHVRDYRRAS